MSLIQEKHLDKMYIYIYESVVVPIKDNAYFWKFSLLLARSAHVSNIGIYLHSGDPYKGYSLKNGGHNISFGKCTGGLTILDPPGPIELSHVALWKFRFRFEASGLPPLTKEILYRKVFSLGEFSHCGYFFLKKLGKLFLILWIREKMLNKWKFLTKYTNHKIEKKEEEKKKH